MKIGLITNDDALKILLSLPWKTIGEVFINIFFLILLCKIIDKITNKITDNLIKADRVQFAKILPMLAKLLKFVLVFLAIAAFLQSQGYSVNSFLAGFGITGLAIGFAAKEALSDIFGSVSVIVDRVFRVGDYVAIGSDEGTVEDINFRSTRLRKLDDTVITLPNRTVASLSITNYSLIRNRVLDETIGIVYGTPDNKLQEAIEIIKNITLEHDKIQKGTQIFIDKLNNSSIDIRFIAHLKTKQLQEMRKIKSEIILKIIEKFRAAGIEFAYPSLSVYMEK